MHGYNMTEAQILLSQVYISLGTLVPISRNQHGKLWLLKKQKMAQKTTLQ